MKNQDKPEDGTKYELSQGVTNKLSEQFARENSSAVLGGVMEIYNSDGEVVDLEVLTLTSLQIGFKDGFETALRWVRSQDV